jgi:peroxiredoxin Q/BCP
VTAGISTDDAASHRKFANRHALEVPLIADPGGAICAELGIPVSAKGFASRTTIVVDKLGVVRRVYENVMVLGHADHVLTFVKGL